MPNTRKFKIRFLKNKVIFWLLALAMPVVLLALLPLTYVLSVIKAISMMRLRIAASEDPLSTVCNNITLPDTFPDDVYTGEVNGKVMH